MAEVVQLNDIQQNVGEQANAFANLPWTTILGLSVLFVMVLLFAWLMIWIVMKIVKRIKDNRRKKEDIEYYKYSTDMKMVLMNSDSQYIKRPWYKLFIFKKMAPVYARTYEGRKYIGDYIGEATKKEGFFIMGIRQKYGFFKYEDDVVIFPIELKDVIVKKNEDFSLDLVCEGIDEVMSSDYYSIPVFKNLENQTKDENYFVDFSNKIMEKYYKDYVYRNVIKQNITEFKQAVTDATEQNPYIQLNRKGGGDLNER